ncbi:methyltransferase domain-containing protein [Planomonospora sp. ID91781]|uniref:class I SAM-dependent DNA methyltransferase n=1 Tax=Planomonospora sp. ID91781 TaxID=2738135 RepID=UPI001A1AC4DA|nr:methyltransferase domain-containing protein [Planomonospora sp. ID91781]MBG0826011.1 methyltransferase domain-containing protein [Planomonospora sp. ID91781]
MTEPDFLRATRDSYDAMAVPYTEFVSGALDRMPLDRAMLAVFAELVLAGGGGPVADLGCGPGRLTAHLHGLGLTVSGIDLSPEMVAIARRAYPHLRFDEGSMTGLDLPDGSLGGVLAWYSTIHTPPERLPEVFGEFHRVLAPGGHLLLGFLSGDGSLRAAEPYDHKVAPAYRWPVDLVADLLGRAGFETTVRLLREPEGGGRHAQGCLLARRPVGGGPGELEDRVTG